VVIMDDLAFLPLPVYWTEMYNTVRGVAQISVKYVERITFIIIWSIKWHQHISKYSTKDTKGSKGSLVNQKVKD